MELAGQKVLVTGAGGFIGSHLVERLIELGADVTCVLHYKSNHDIGHLSELSYPARSSMSFVFGDITDFDFVQRAVKGQNIVFHLAAMISVPFSFEAPGIFLQTNTTGTYNVLQASRNAEVDRVIHTSTSEVYGSPDFVPITENHPLKAQSPYAATKIGADKMAESFFHTYGTPVTVLRPFNTYGPRQSMRALVATVVAQLLDGSGVVRIGSLWPRRDLTYVSDTVSGFIKTAEIDAAVGKTVHLGTGKDLSVAELVEMAQSVLGINAEVIVEDHRVRPENAEVTHLVSDTEYASQLLGWKPTVDIEAGLKLTAEWMSRDRSWKDSSEYQL